MIIIRKKYRNLYMIYMWSNNLFINAYSIKWTIIVQCAWDCLLNIKKAFPDCFYVLLCLTLLFYINIVLMVLQFCIIPLDIASESESVKMFDRTSNLANNQIINYKWDSNEKWLVLIRIAPGSPKVCMIFLFYWSFTKFSLIDWIKVFLFS